MDGILNGIPKASLADLVEHIKDDNVQHVKFSVQYRAGFKNKTLDYEFQNFFEFQQFINTINFNLFGFDDKP